MIEKEREREVDRERERETNKGKERETVDPHTTGANVCQCEKQFQTNVPNIKHPTFVLLCIDGLRAVSALSFLNKRNTVFRHRQCDGRYGVCCKI